MHTHNSSCLAGPISRARNWWRMSTNETESKDETKGKEPMFRAALVERIRQEIAHGTYETPEKWEAALERLSRWLEVGTLEALDPVGQAGGSGAPVGPSAGHPTGAKSQTFTFERPS